MSATLEMDVVFGGVSIGDQTARLSVRIDRGRLNLQSADECFCGKRLTGAVQLGGKGDASGQKKLEGMEDAFERLAAVFDVKRFGVSPSDVSLGLTFARESIDISELAKFAKKTGRLIVEEVAELPEDAKGDDDADDPPPPRRTRGKPNPRQQTLPGADPRDQGAVQPISLLAQYGLTKKKCQAVSDAVSLAMKGDTIWHLERFMNRNEYWHRDIPGFGQTWIDKLIDAHVALRRDFPYVDPSDPPLEDADEQTVLDGDDDDEDEE